MTRTVDVLRRLVLLAAGALCAATALSQSRPPSSGLPLRNLLVEVRMGDAASLASSTAGIESGAVVIGSDGRMSGRASVDVDARSRDAGLRSMQQLRVLNGGRGALRIGSSQPVQWLQIGWTPQGPAVVGLGSSWVDTGRGIVVQPRWPGGDAPVTVELQAESSSAPGADGSIASASTLTTLALPLGEWVTVAESGQADSRRERGVLSTREMAAERRFVVQMRVSLP